METNPKKSIENLKDQEVDGTSVKGGFTLTNKVEGTGYYTFAGAEDKNAALNDAKIKGFKYAVLTHRITGESRTFTI